MIPEDVFYKVIRSAVKAPSGHNTQPWVFKKGNDYIRIMPDFSRSLNIADANHREMFISLGCATETAIIASRFYGFKPDMNIEKLNNEPAVIIKLTEGDKSVEDSLFSFIHSRQTSRTLYQEKKIPEADIEALKNSVSYPEISLRFFNTIEEFKKIEPYIIEANSIQMGDPDFKNELINWMRFSEKEARMKGDGLYTACSGIPDMGRTIGSFVLKNFVTAKSEQKRLLGQLEKSALVVLFSSKSDDLDHWLKTGMAFQRFALMATKLNISHSYLNLPCQVREVGAKMIEKLGLNGEFPQLLIRMGYSKKMPPSFRRQISEVITN